MKKFVHEQNLKHLRELLANVTDEEKRDQLKRLLAEEEAADPPPKIAPPRD
jgi:hypothetical protein